MKVLRYFIRFYVIVCYLVRKLSKTGPFDKDAAFYITRETKSGDNMLKKSMFKNHVKQFNEASCSVASIVSVINAVREEDGCVNGEILTQKKILEDVKVHRWKKRMGPGGDNGKRGLPLDILGDIVKGSLDQYKISYKDIDVVTAEKSRDRAEIIKKKLRERLISYEKEGNCLILAHFNQGVFVKTIGLPHISPVGGFDPEREKVTMLDVDPEQDLPYEISFKRFYEGLSNDYNGAFKAFGYGSGGYVYVKLR